MKRLVSIFLFLGFSVLANNNFIRVENGKVVEKGFSNTLHSLTRSSSEGSSTSNDQIFSGVINCKDVLDKNSPFSQWVDDLLNPESDPYKQAVVEALKLLLVILLAALAPFGIDTFTILILGFSPGSVEVNYELAIPSDVYAIAGMPPTSEAATDIGNKILEVISSEEVEDPNSGQIWYLNREKTRFVDDVSSCPPCWRIVAGECVPDPAFYTLTCNSGNMELSVDYCVMGNTDVDSLSLKGGCDANNGNIIDNGSGSFVATTGLDECSSVMSFEGDYVKFENTLSGSYDNGIISTFDRYSVHFQCSYETTYDNIGGATNVTSSVNSGNTNDVIGELSFKMKTFEDSTFTNTDVDGHAIVGTTLYFGVELENPISGVEFTVTDCQVYSDIDFQSENTLQYNIFTDRCVNNRVNFQVWQGTSADMTKFSYTVFEFNNMQGFNTLYLNCRVVVCEEGNSDSTCNADANCASSRKKRSGWLTEWAWRGRGSHGRGSSLGARKKRSTSLNEGTKYFNVKLVQKLNYF